MRTQTLQDGAEAFEVSFYEAAGSHLVLFAAGAGGQPERYATLLGTLADAGCTVVTPHFERLASPFPTEAELTLRARRLSLALDAFVRPGMTAAAVGHSIGAATLIALAGAQLWLVSGRRVNIERDDRLTRLALLAPPTGFFRVPGALDAVQVPMLAWAASEDVITPPAQTEWLARAMQDRPMQNGQKPDVRITSGAGHFSFMDLPPPHTTEPLANKQAFLREYSSEVCHFLMLWRQ